MALVRETSQRRTARNLAPRQQIIAGFDVTAKDAKGHAARIAKEVYDERGLT